MFGLLLHYSEGATVNQAGSKERLNVDMGAKGLSRHFDHICPLLRQIHCGVQSVASWTKGSAVPFPKESDFSCGFGDPCVSGTIPDAVLSRA